jgi:hypothetical protein
MHKTQIKVRNFTKPGSASAFSESESILLINATHYVLLIHKHRKLSSQ